MTNQISKTISALFILIALFIFLKPSPSYASACFGSSAGTIGTYENYNSGTVWQVESKYCRSGGVPSNCPQTNAAANAGTLNWPATFTLFLTNTGSNPNYYDWYQDGYAPHAGDAVKWQTACVDPVVGVVATTFCTPDGNYHIYNEDVSCKSAAASSTVYGGCGNSGTTYSTYANNLGQVNYAGACPICNGQSGVCACTSSGIHGASCDIGCNGTCTQHYCSGTSCASKAYSTACGGTGISGTTMCSSTSVSCAPPGPTVTATASCNGVTPQISTNWTAPLHSDGTYDLRWRVAAGAFTNVCTPAKPFVISSGLTAGTTYEVQVRSHTTSGYNGPTAFGSDTVVAPNCAAPTPTHTPTPTPVGPTSTPTPTPGGPTPTNTPTPTFTPTPTPVGPTSTPTPTPAPTFSISGNVYVDANNNGIKDFGEANYSGATLTLSGGGSGTTNTNINGNYSFAGNPAGSYTVTVTVPSGYTAPTPSQNATLGPNATRNFRLVPVSSITINVYQDLNGNGVDDGASEPGYSGGAIVVTGKGAGAYTTNANGQVVLSNLTLGNSTITLTVPVGWRLTTANNPKSVSIPPSQTVNFGIQPPAPVCSGGLTANPTTVHPGQNSTLTANGCTIAGQGGTITYTWLTPAPGAITSTNPSAVNTATWTAPNPYWTDSYAYPSVNVCQTGTALCTPYAISNGLGINNSGIHIIPLFTVSGNVFVDQNKDGLQNGSDSNYTGGITITPNPAGASVTYNNGDYTISNMTGGQYTISYTSLPSGYQIIYPKNGPPPSFTVRVGNVSTGGVCNNGGSNSATCDVNGNITSVRYGISNSLPWIQCIGGDCTGPGVTSGGGGGFTDPIPQGATCGTYASLVGAGGTPGVIYSGAGSYDFGSGQASANPYNWVVGGLNYPEPINVNSPLITSYSYVYSTAQKSGTIKDISSYCGAGGISSCHLPANLANGFYVSNGDLTLTGPSYTFPAGKNFVIMVNGNLNIQTEIHVPVGSTAFFTAAKDINVDKSIGEVSTSSTRSNIEGYYSSDHFFYVQGVNACPTSDLRVNFAGAIIVNASLGGGSFVNQRDLCAQDLQCPAISIIERPDFVLYSPEYLKIRRIWQEVAP